MVFQCIDIRQVPLEVLKTAASGLGFQHLPRDLANVNALKTMFDPYNRDTIRRLKPVLLTRKRVFHPDADSNYKHMFVSVGALYLISEIHYNH